MYSLYKTLFRLMIMCSFSFLFFLSLSLSVYFCPLFENPRTQLEAPKITWYQTLVSTRTQSTRVFCIFSGTPFFIYSVDTLLSWGRFSIALKKWMRPSRAKLLCLNLAQQKRCPVVTPRYLLPPWDYLLLGEIAGSLNCLW